MEKLILEVSFSGFLSYEIAEIMSAEADRLENVFPAAFKSFVFHFNNSVTLKTDIIERRYKGTPVHIAQTRDFRAHIVQRIRKHTALRQFFRIQFNIFEVHMENLIFKLI